MCTKCNTLWLSSGGPAGLQRQELIVVASLIDKAPNLAGLARTCEVGRLHGKSFYSKFVVYNFSASAGVVAKGSIMSFVLLLFALCQGTIIAERYGIFSMLHVGNQHGLSLKRCRFSGRLRLHWQISRWLPTQSSKTSASQQSSGYLSFR